MNTTEPIVTLDLPRSHYDAVYALAIMRELSLNDALALLITEGFNAIETNSLVKKTMKEGLEPINERLKQIERGISGLTSSVSALPCWSENLPYEVAVEDVDE